MQIIDNITNKRKDSYDYYFNNRNLKVNFREKAVKSAGITVITQITIQFLQIAGVIILARLLKPSDFGLVAMVAAISSFFLMFRRMGLTDATVQKDNINHELISTLFWLNFFFSLALTIILSCLAPLIAIFYGEPKLLMITIISSIGFFIGGISTQHLALLRRNLKFNFIAYIEILSVIISILMSIFLATKGFGYWAIVAKPLIATFFMTLGAFLLCKWRPGLPVRNSGVVEMLKFGFNVLGTYIVNYFSTNLDKILIGWRYGPTFLGYYHKAFHLFMAPAQQTTLPLTSVAVATLSRLKDEPYYYCKYYFKAFRLIAFFGFFLSTVLTVFSEEIILLLLGAQWIGAVKIFSVFGVGIGVQMLYSSIAWLHLSLGNADKWFRWGIFASIVTTAAFIVGLPFGTIGVATAYTASIYVLSSLGLVYAGKPVGISFMDITREVWRFFMSALITGFLCWILFNNYQPTFNIMLQFHIFTKTIIGVFVCFIIYLGSTVLLYLSFNPIKEVFTTLDSMLPSTFRKGNKKGNCK